MPISHWMDLAAMIPGATVLTNGLQEDKPKPPANDQSGPGQGGPWGARAPPSVVEAEND